jgi:hypothetical protein
LTYRDIGTVADKNFIVKNGVTIGNIVLKAVDGSIAASSANLTGNFTVSGTSRVGSIANLHVTGGNSGDAIVTDGTGNLSFAQISGSVSPMPYYIFTGTTITIPNYYQALSGMVVTIDGTLDVEGYYIEV